MRPSNDDVHPAGGMGIRSNLEMEIWRARVVHQNIRYSYSESSGVLTIEFRHLFASCICIIISIIDGFGEYE